MIFKGRHVLGRLQREVKTIGGFSFLQSRVPYSPQDVRLEKKGDSTARLADRTVSALRVWPECYRVEDGFRGLAGPYGVNLEAGDYSCLPND